jgi:hypothetical protein
MLLLVTLPDEDYKRIVKAPRAVTPNEAFNQRIELLNMIKKARPVKNKIFYRCDHQIEKCKNSITCGGEDCNLTEDITHAVNFNRQEDYNGTVYFVEKANNNQSEV